MIYSELEIELEHFIAKKEMEIDGLLVYWNKPLKTISNPTIPTNKTKF